MPPPPPSFLPRVPAPFLVLALCLGVAPVLGCAGPKARPVTQIGLSRDTPEKAYEYLKAMVAANQVEAEWQAFSPGFKRRLSSQAGRNVDLGDYSMARGTIASNSTKELQLLLSSELAGTKMLSDDVALVTIRSGKKRASPRFVRLTTWELRLAGEGEPVAEFVPSPSDVIGIAPDGSVEMRVTPSSSTASFLKDFQSDRIRGFQILERWYLDDFGGVEDVVVGGLRGKGTTPPPPGTPEPPPVPGSPDGAGPGSPDGAPFGSPDGGPVGSPDGAPAR